MGQLVEDFFSFINSAINSVKPEQIFKTKVKINEALLEYEFLRFDLNQFEKIYVIGFGKASSSMATEIEKYLYDRIVEGIVITKYGFKTPTKKIKIFEAGHPVPDENTIKYSGEVINLLHKTTNKDLVICLISGGGSSLFEVLTEGISLKDLQTLNDFLIKQKIPINQINFYRKSISEVKGGKLLRYIYPSTCISLIISDVVGNDLSTIASGPTFISQNNTTPQIKNVNEFKRSLNENLDVSSLNYLIMESNFEKEIVKYFHDKVFNFIIVSNNDAVNSVIEKAKSNGYEVCLVKKEISDSVENISDFLIKEFNKINQLHDSFRNIIVLGGEPYVEVKASGLGGRNSHLILHTLNEIISKNLEFNFDFLLASVATDGNDGPTDSAGAYITNQLLEKIKSSRINVEDYLNNFDSYNFFEQINSLIKIGSTFTNVADLIIGLFEK